MKNPAISYDRERYMMLKAAFDQAQRERRSNFQVEFPRRLQPDTYDTAFAAATLHDLHTAFALPEIPRQRHDEGEEGQ